MCPLPAVRSLRPLCLAPGADNIMQATSTLQNHGSFPPTLPATVVSAKYETGRFRLVSNSALIANTPLLPALFPDPLYMYCDNAATSSNFNGIWYARASGNTSSIGSNFIQMTYAVANASTNAVGMADADGATSLTNDKTPQTGIFTDRSTPPITVDDGDERRRPGEQRDERVADGNVARHGGRPSMNWGCPMLFAWAAATSRRTASRRPAARNSTSNNHEKEVSTIGYGKLRPATPGR